MTRVPYIAAEFTGVRVVGKHSTVTRNFYRRSANNPDGTVPGFIYWRHKRYDGHLFKVNGVYFFESKEPMA